MHIKNTTKYKKISANKFAEYVDAKPSRQETIIKQRISEKGYGPQYYILAKSAICRLMNTEGRAIEEVYENEKASITAHAGYGANPGKLIANNLLALESFMLIQKQGLPSGEYRKPTAKLSPKDRDGLIISNSVDAEIIVKQRVPKYGAVKLYFSKEHSLKEFSGALLATLLSEDFENVFGARNVARSSVIVIDVFNMKIHYAPCANKRNLREIDATAKAIISRWHYLTDL